MKKIKNRIESLGYNYKKEVLLLLIPIIVVLLAGISLIFLYKNLMILMFCWITIFVYICSFYYRYVKKEESDNRRLINSFISYFGFFKIFINNGDSVYSALNKTLNFASNDMKPYLEGLIKEIDVDKTITPFIRFASYFKMKLIEDIMISIYEMIENGNSPDYINRFSTIFENFKIRINEQNNEQRVSKFDNFISSSLVGSGLIMIILVYGIINLIGEIVWAIN